MVSKFFRHNSSINFFNQAYQVDDNFDDKRKEISLDRV